MSDQDLRELERATKTCPRDGAARERLDLARFRLRLGWHGEALPLGVEPLTNVRGVYLAELPVEPTPGGTPIPRVFVDLVYVPGGEVECDSCRGTGHVSTLLRDGRPCPDCSTQEDRRAPMSERRRGTGKATISPFYLGRFPLTWREWAAFWRVEEARDPDRRRELSLAPDPDGVNAHYPAVNVSHADAIAFCSWAGLRLPTEGEWRWAAFGAGLPSLDAASPPPWATSHKTLRRYPWGDEPPSLRRCVWREHPFFGSAFNVTEDGWEIERSGGPAPVVERAGLGECLGHRPTDSTPGVVEVGQAFAGGRTAARPLCGCVDLRPARPAGASWRGVHDMAGNVWEWLSAGGHAGGSFRSSPAALGIIASPGQWLRGSGIADDVGFRVALSVST